MKNLNLSQKSGMPQTVIQQKVNTSKGDTTKFETETIKSSLSNYSDAFYLVTGNITVAANNDTDVLFKNCAPFSTCKTVTNYSDTSGSLSQFKKDEVPANNVDLTIDNSESFEYKAALVGKTANAKKCKIAL